MVKLGYNVPDENVWEKEIAVNVLDVLFKVAELSGVGTTRMSELAGRNKSFISTLKNKGTTPKVDTLSMLLHTAGWSLVAVPDDQIPEGALVIDAPAVTVEDKKLLNERKKAALLRQLDKLEAEGELLG